MGTEFPDGLTDRPEQFIVGMGLEASLIGKGEHLVVDTGGIADTKDVDTTVYEFLRNPVDGHVTLRTDQHLTLPSQRFIDGFDKRSGLARSRRTMHNGHILRPQHLVHSFLLRRIQIRKTHGRKAEGLCFLTRIEKVAQVAEPTLSLHHTVEGLKHRLIARLVEEDLDAHILCPLHIDQLAVVRHSHHHTVAIDIADGACEVEIMEDAGLSRKSGMSGFDSKKAHWFTKFKVMLYLVVLTLTEHLHDQLIE